MGVGSGVGVHDACSVDFVDVSKHGNTAPVTHEDREHQDADYMVDTFAHFELMLLLLYICLINNLHNVMLSEHFDLLLYLMCIFE